MSRCLIVGNGPSAHVCGHWPDDVPIMAVSSGFDAAPHIDHFVTLDKPICFPDWLVNSQRFSKHVPSTSKVWGRWKDHPKVVGWEYDWREWPVTWSYGRCIAGLSQRNNSLLFAVQVAHRLKFEHLTFIGCDLQDIEHKPISEKLKEWHADAITHGYVWENASAVSRLQEWMPTGDLFRVMAGQLGD